ncbi:GroES-like protein [Sparassis latifolia]
MTHPKNDVNWHADGLEPLLFSYQIVPFRPFPTATMSAVEFKGYALTDTKKWSDLKVVEFKPKTFLEDDVELRITHCGVCGSDVHTLSQGWGETTNLPLIVGHEIVGVVIRVGSNVTEFKPGERVGIGAQIGSCMKCQRCKHDQENYCREIIYTYNASYPDGVATQGGYSTAIRAHQQFVFAIPDALESRYAASMLCAGLTMFAPLKLNGAGPGKKVGIIGIGGLGHYGILFAKALGAEVYAFTHSPSKIEDAKKMGADHVIDTGASDFHEPLYGELDLIVTTLDNFSPDRPLQTYTSMLRVFGKLVNVGVPDADNLLPPMHAMSLCFNGAFFSGSHLGSKVDCNDMLKLAAEKGVKPWIQELPMSQAKTAVENVKKGNVRYRYVLSQDINPVV